MQPAFKKNTTTAMAARRELHTPDAVAAVRRTCGGAERVDADVMRGCTPQRMLGNHADDHEKSCFSVT